MLVFYVCVCEVGPTLLSQMRKCSFTRWFPLVPR